jgi:predicted signal transduction protein with EAL and GGDEF domain
VHYKLHDDAEAYYRKQLLLYHPWEAKATDPVRLYADEDAYLLAGHATFESRYESVKNVLEANRKRYEFNDRLDWDEVQRTAKEIADADDLLFQTGFQRVANADASLALQDETYDIGQDLGIVVASSSASDSSVSMMRMTDSNFRADARRLI